MEKIKIEQFLELNSGDGSGYGYGFDDGFDDGSGYGGGYGFDDGFDDGSGYGGGYGFVYGGGYGFDYGFGYGSGYGGGYGYDYIKSINGEKIYNVDRQPTIFYSIHKDVAKCAIFNKDFTFTPCYVVKGSGHFAHGETIKKAMKDLEKKIFNGMGIEEKIDAFLREFELDKKYPAHKFYEWHHKLTGSCEMGRKTFVEKHNMDLDKDEFTVEEFIELTQNDFGGEVIKELKGRKKNDKWR